MSTIPPSAANPTLVFVPGAHHVPEHFSTIISLLEQKSYPSVAISLPSIGYGLEAQTASLLEDVLAIRKVLVHLVEVERKEVVLVIHSYGGVPGCQAVRGLDKETRVSEGKEEGGIVHCIFLAALLVSKGDTLVGALGEGGLAPWYDLDGVLLRPKPIISSFLYNDLPPSQARHYTSLLQPISVRPSTVPVNNPCWDILSLKVTYVICEEDASLLKPVCNQMLDKVKGENWTIESMKTGHCPFLGQPGKIVEIIQR